MPVMPVMPVMPRVLPTTTNYEPDTSFVFLACGSGAQIGIHVRLLSPVSPRQAPITGGMPELK